MQNILFYQVLYCVSVATTRYERSTDEKRAFVTNLHQIISRNYVELFIPHCRHEHIHCVPSLVSFVCVFLCLVDTCEELLCRLVAR